MSGRIRIGVGGWVFEPWDQSFYPARLPKKRQLEFMSRAMTAIEVNGTYYGSQKPDTFAAWRDETPDDFVFALKGPRFATNRRVLAESGSSVERFVTGGITRLGAKLGPINWQFLPTKAFDPADFAAFLDLLPAQHDGIALRHAVEVRHPSFAVPEFVDLCRTRGVAIVLAGDSDHPLIADATAPCVYARIMGTTEANPDGYPDTARDTWADRARCWADGSGDGGLPRIGSGDAVARDVFLFVIGGAKQHNPAAAQALIRRVGGV
jgi:uncharacterized protein YecE (DUF72 family)